MEDWNWVAPLLHFSDSALPVGAYAHSFGLEGVCQSGVVCDRQSLSEFLCRDVAHALQCIDLPLSAKTHASAMDGNLAEIKRLDELSWALRPTRQLREAASKIGRQQWLLYRKTWQREIELTLPCYQSPVVLGVIGAHESIPVLPLLHSLTYQTFSALLQAALKLLPIGPGASQSILHEALSVTVPLLESSCELPEESWGSFNPLWDIGAAAHERAHARLFIS